MDRHRDFVDMIVGYRDILRKRGDHGLVSLLYLVCDKSVLFKNKNIVTMMKLRLTDVRI